MESVAADVIIRLALFLVFLGIMRYILRLIKEVRDTKIAPWSSSSPSGKPRRSRPRSPRG